MGGGTDQAVRRWLAHELDEEVDPAHWPLLVTVTVVDDEGLSLVAGEVDRFSAPGLAWRLAAAFDLGARRMVVDVASMGFVDGAGLRVLTKAAQRFRDHGGELLLVGARPSLRQLVRILGADRLLVVCDAGP